jgi:colanic acid biosynthesis glycosyl transferase WcaI
VSRVLLHSLIFAPDGVSTAYLMTDLAVELSRLGHRVSVLTTTPHYNVHPEALARHPLQRRGFGLWYESRLGDIAIWHVTLPAKSQRVWARGLHFIHFHLVSLLLGLLSIGRQDIVISTSPPLTVGVVSWLLGARWGAPSVYKVAEVYPDLAIRQGVIRGRPAIALWRGIEQIVYRRSAMIVPIADQFRRIIAERGVPARKLQVIPDCVDTELYRPLPRRTAFAAEYGLLDDFVLLYAGNIGLVQDWESILHAAAAVAGQPIRFVVVGDGVRREWLEREVASRGLTNVRLLGYQPKERMPEINASCDIALIPLTTAGSKDGFPSKVYSTLASGRPVLVSAPSGAEIAELVTANGCGRSVVPEDGAAYAEAVLAAYRDRALLPEEGRRGRALIERDYSKEAIGRRYDALIRACCQVEAPAFSPAQR